MRQIDAVSMDAESFQRQSELLATRLLQHYKAADLNLAVAESCSGGLLAQAIVDVPGASAIFCGGIVSYSNAAKTRLLGVPEALLQKHGAVSAETAQAMAAGARLAFPESNRSIAITGVAGPEESDKKPAGLVYIAYDADGEKTCEAYNFIGERTEVRRQSVLQAMQILIHNL